MSEPTRDDLRRVKYTDDPDFGRIFSFTKVTDAEFDRIAREQGYVKVGPVVALDSPAFEMEAGQWARENPSRALSAALTETCETCETCGGKGHDGHLDPNGEPNPSVCPDCGGTGKRLKDELVPLDMAINGIAEDGEPGYWFPASWLEADSDT